MVKTFDKNAQRMKRHTRVRGKISGTPERPRLNVYRSNANIYAQIIDDVNGVTLAAASSVEKDFEGATGNKEAARKVGKLVAERAKAKGIDTVVFDRGGYIYHGRVAELAEGAREAARRALFPDDGEEILPGAGARGLHGVLQRGAAQAVSGGAGG